MTSITDNPANSKIKAFKQRSLSSLFLLAVLGTTIYMNQPWLYGVLILLFSALTAFEWKHMLTVSGTPSQPYLSLFFNLGFIGLTLIPLGMCFSQGDSFAFANVKEILLLGALFYLPALSIASFTWEMRRPVVASNPLRAVGSTILSFVYPNYLFMFSLVLVLSDSNKNSLNMPMSIAYLLFVIVITKCSDIFAYISGSCIGGRFFEKKLIPHISPKKTWEGIIGSFVLTQTAGFYLGNLLLQEIIWPCGFELISVPSLVLFGFISVIFVLAVIGDLAGSLIKRSLAVKDSGSLLPGIGGIFDLIDSPAFTVPLATLLWILWF